MAFRVGQKVVCVDNSQWGHRLTLNVVYTISALGTPWDDGLYVGLEETPGKHELQWRARRFRPVVATGMAILEQIRRDVTDKELRPIWEDA